MMMISVSHELSDRILEQLEPAIREAIAALRLEQAISGFCLVLCSSPGKASELNEQLLRVCRVATNVIPLGEVEFDGDRLSIEALATIAPTVHSPMEGKKDIALADQQITERSLLCESAIQALAEHYNVFLISPDGVYGDVVFHKGTQSLIPAEDMIGKRLAEIIGEHSEEIILECLKVARQTGERQECSYDVQFECGEHRWYIGKAHPLTKAGQLYQLFLVKRVG